MDGFAALQAKLGAAWSVNKPGSDVDHVLVVLPSHSVPESVLAHYGPRVPALEHRYLVAMMMLHRIPSCEIVFLCSREPEPEVLDYYGSLLPGAGREHARS